MFFYTAIICKEIILDVGIIKIDEFWKMDINSTGYNILIEIIYA